MYIIGNILIPPMIDNIGKSIKNILNIVFVIYNKDNTYGRYLLIKRNNL